MEAINHNLKQLSLNNEQQQQAAPFVPPYLPNQIPPPYMDPPPLYYYDRQIDYNTNKVIPCPPNMQSNPYPSYPGPAANVTWMVNSEGVLVPTYQMNTAPMRDPRMCYSNHHVCNCPRQSTSWNGELHHHRCYNQPHSYHQYDTQYPAGIVTNEEINFDTKTKMLPPSASKFRSRSKMRSNGSKITTAREERYESCDSGIAESSAVSSEASWDGNDESSSEYETASETTKHNFDLESPDYSEKEAFFGSAFNGKQLPLGNLLWTLKDDNAYWASTKRSSPNSFILSSIAKQVDFYLSDEYLLKDKYLLRQVQCNKEQCISIKLITSFKKMKKLTRDWCVVRSAILRKSSRLSVTSDGLRIIRKEKLADSLQKPRLLSTVLVIRLPPAYNSVDKVTSLFGYFGEISSVRLLRTNKEIPIDLRNYATQVYDIGRTLCAVIEYESPNDALASVRAIRFLQQNTTNSSTHSEKQTTDQDFVSSIEKLTAFLKGMPSLDETRLALLGPRIRRTLYRQDKQTSTNEKLLKTQQTQPEMEKTTSRVCAESSKQSESINKCSNTKELDINRIPLQKYKFSKLSSEMKQRPNKTFITRRPNGPNELKGFRTRKNSW